MTKRIRIVGSTERRVRDTSKGQRRIDPEALRAALGAESTGVVVPPVSQPFSLYAIRKLLAEQVRSSGGRPGLAGTERRQKIPLTDVAWHRLETLAQALQDTGVSTTAGQLASVLIQQALEHFTDEEIRRLPQLVEQIER